MDTKKEFKRIGTHDGRFHADEVMATAILKQIFEVELVRTRDQDKLNDLDIVYDVGGGEFDHHDLEKRYRENGIPFAACGLIWYRFGRDVIRFKAPDLSEEEVEGVFNHIDRILIEGIDALDNGMRARDGEVVIMSITSMISGFNPAWNSRQSEDEAFNNVVEFITAVLSNSIDNRLAVLKARSKVIEAFNSRKVPAVLNLDIYCPYGEVLQEIDKNKEVLFVIYPRKDGYAIQSVRDRGWEDRKKLPEAWAGRRDEDLAEVSGVEDAVFCHSARFIAVSKSYEGIMKMAQLAIEEPEPEQEIEEKAQEPQEPGFFEAIRRLFLGER